MEMKSPGEKEGTRGGAAQAGRLTPRRAPVYSPRQTLGAQGQAILDKLKAK